MFTGIIRQIGLVKAIRPGPSGKRLTLEAGPLAASLGLGDSLAVNGACLTVAAVVLSEVQFDLSAETIAKTTFAKLRPGDRVNLEPALRLDEGLHGHLVQGHVDGTARVAQVRTAGEYVMTFSAGAELTGQMVSKGSVAVDGVSLTVAELGADSFSVAIIPATLGQTTLGALQTGDLVNIEVDLLGKYVRAYLGRMASLQAPPITLERLRRAGFA